MSQKNLFIKLLDSMPEYRLGCVLAYLRAITVDELEDYEFCVKLLLSHLGDIKCLQYIASTFLAYE